MISVIFYNFILFSSTFFVWLSEKISTRAGRGVILSFAFLLVFLPSAIRYDIGTDYFNYVAIYNDNFGIPLDYFKLKEPGFYFVHWILQTIDAHFQWMFVVFSFIFSVMAFSAYPKKNAWLLHFIFFSSLWFFSFNGVRQATAISFCFFSLFYFFEKRYFRFFMFSIIGAMFHQSAIFIVIAGASALIPISEGVKFRVAPFLFITTILFVFFSMGFILDLIKGFLNILGFVKYANYFNNSTHFGTRDFGSGLGILTKLLFSIYLILNTRNFLQLNKQYWFLIVLVFIYTIALVLASNIIIFGRVSTLFVVGPIVAGFLLLQIPKNKSINKCVLSVFLCFLILTFTKVGIGEETSYANPKLNPYKTIFLYE